MKGQPIWALLAPDGTSVYGAAGQSPRDFLGLPGEVLVLPWAILAPTEDGSIDWVTTVKVSLDGQDTERWPGPGISSPNAVRVWITKTGRVVITDGGVEEAYRAEELIESFSSEEKAEEKAED